MLNIRSNIQNGITNIFKVAAYAKNIAWYITHEAALVCPQASRASYRDDVRNEAITTNKRRNPPTPSFDNIDNDRDNWGLATETESWNKEPDMTGWGIPDPFAPDED